MSFLKFLFRLIQKKPAEPTLIVPPVYSTEETAIPEEGRTTNLDTFLPPDSAERDGSTVERAIMVQAVKEEYAWMLTNYPGYTLSMQSILQADSRFYDVMEWRNAAGATCKVYFDVTDHFARLAELLK